MSKIAPHWSAQTTATLDTPTVTPPTTAAPTGWADDEPIGPPECDQEQPDDIASVGDPDNPDLSDRARQIIHELAGIGVRVHLRHSGLSLEGHPDTFPAAAALVMPHMGELLEHVQALHDRHSADLDQLCSITI
jgi:hypothetical protein